MSNRFRGSFNIVYYDIDVDPVVLLRYPKFKDFNKKVLPENLSQTLRAINARPEVKAYVKDDQIRIVLSDSINSDNTIETDALGYPLPSRELNDLCDVIREFSRVDPRKQVVVSQKSLPLSDRLTVEVLRVDAFGRSMKRGSHPLDIITDEEIHERRSNLEKRKQVYEEKDSKREKSSEKSLQKSVRTPSPRNRQS